MRSMRHKLQKTTLPAIQKFFYAKSVIKYS